jgi:hypothetical protein
VSSRLSLLPTIARSFPTRVLIGSLLVFATFGVFIYEQAASEQPVEGRAQTADEALAARVLGQPLPRPALPPIGWTRTQLTLTPADPAMPVIPAMVHQAFGIGGTNVALLTIFKGSMVMDVPTAFDGTINLNGAVAGIKTHQLPDGSMAMNYKWNRHGLVYNLEINLAHGIDRSIADRVAASIP